MIWFVFIVVTLLLWMQRFLQKESPVLFPLATENNKSSPSYRNVPNMCRCSSGVTADLHLSVEYSVSPLLLVQLFYFYTFQQQNQTEALWSAASRRCSSACVNWSQSLRASVRRLQSVGRLAALTAAAADDSLSECINNAKSYLHSAKKTENGTFFCEGNFADRRPITGSADVPWKWFTLKDLILRAACCVFVCPSIQKCTLVCNNHFFDFLLIWLFEYRKLCGWLELMKKVPLNSGCPRFSASCSLSRNKNQSWMSASNPPKVTGTKVLRLLLSTNPESNRANVN